MIKQEEIEIHSWLNDNRDLVREQAKDLLNVYNTLLKTENRVFFEEINNQFAAKIKEFIAIKAGEALAVSPGDILQCVNDLNLEQYINKEHTK
jgi:hypothetical protein